MTDDGAWWSVLCGVVLLIAGRALLGSGDALLLPMWGAAMAVIGIASVVLGAGILLRLWR